MGSILECRVCLGAGAASQRRPGPTRTAARRRSVARARAVSVVTGWLEVSMGVDVVDAGEWSVLVGVTDDVTDDGEDSSVVTGWLEVSLGGVAVVVCSALVPVAGDV